MVSPLLHCVAEIEVVAGKVTCLCVPHIIAAEEDRE